MTHIKIMGAAKKRRTWCPAPLLIAIATLIGTLALFAAMVMAADGLERKIAYETAQARV